MIHNGAGGVVFSDASGFTALTEKLAKKSNGAVGPTKKARCLAERKSFGSKKIQKISWIDYCKVRSGGGKKAKYKATCFFCVGFKQSEGLEEASCNSTVSQVREVQGRYRRKMHVVSLQGIFQQAGLGTSVNESNQVETCK